MSGHSNKDSNQLKKSNKFKLGRLTRKQKTILGSGGLSTLLASGMIYKLFNSKSSIQTDETNIQTISEVPEINESIVVDPNLEFDNQDIETLEKDVIEEDFYSFTADTNISFSQIPHDSMTFSEAYASARNDIGPDGFFNWNGNTYSTYSREEWDQMDEQEHQHFFNQVTEQTDIETIEWKEYASPEKDVINPIITSENETSNETENIILDSDQENYNETFASEEINQVVTEEVIADDIIIVRPQYGVADMNDDGVYDAIVLDNDHDGLADIVILDENVDGTYDHYMVDTDDDQDLDVYIIDEGVDGQELNESSEEISDVVNMEDFIILEDDDPSIEEYDFMEDLFNEKAVDSLSNEDNNDISIDNDFDEPEF